MAWRCFLMSALVGFAAGGAALPGSERSLPLPVERLPGSAIAVAAHPSPHAPGPVATRVVLRPGA